MRVALAALVPLAIVAGCSSGGRHAQDACASKQLGVFAVTQGGGGATIGDLRLRNDGSADCWLRGRAALAILDGGGRPLAIRVVPPKRATMRLAPHAAAEVRFQWHNWCKLTAPAALRLVLPESGGTIQTKADIGRARCDEAKAPSDAGRLDLRRGYVDRATASISGSSGVSARQKTPPFVDS